MLHFFKQIVSNPQHHLTSRCYGAKATRTHGRRNERYTSGGRLKNGKFAVNGERSFPVRQIGAARARTNDKSMRRVHVLGFGAISENYLCVDLRQHIGGSNYDFISAARFEKFPRGLKEFEELRYDLRLTFPGNHTNQGLCSLISPGEFR